MIVLASSRRHFIVALTIADYIHFYSAINFSLSSSLQFNHWELVMPLLLVCHLSSVLTQNCGQDSNSGLGFTAVGLKEQQLGVRGNPLGTRQIWKFDGNRSEKQGKVNS